MEFRQLRYFIAVTNLGSFSRAAEHLHVAQSAISRQIQNLEDEMGVALILRSNRSLQPTEAGLLFLERATSIVELVRSVKGDLQEYAEVPKGDLRVGNLPSTTELLFPRALSNFVRSYPQIQVQVRSGMSGAVQDWLKEDLIDVGLMHSPWSGNEFISETLVYGQMVLVMPDTEAAERIGIAEQERYTLREVAGMPLILTTTVNAQRILLDREAAIQGLQLNAILEADNVGTIVALIREGLGCTVIAYSAIHTMLSRGGLRFAPLVDPVLWTDISIVVSRRRPVSAAMRAYIAAIKTEVKQLAARTDLPQQYFTLAAPRR